MEFFSGLSTVQQLVLFGVVGYVVYTYFLAGPNSPDLFTVVKDFFSGLFNKAKDVKMPSLPPSLAKKSSAPSTVELVEKWEGFRNELLAAGLTDAVAELDEIWKLMNPNTKKD